MTAIVLLSNCLVADVVSDRGNHSFINRGKLVRQGELIWGGAGLCYSPAMLLASNLAELALAIKEDGESRHNDAYLAHFSGRSWMGSFEKGSFSWSEAHPGAVIGCYTREWLNYSCISSRSAVSNRMGSSEVFNAIYFMRVVSQLSGFNFPFADSYTIQFFPTSN